jgi:hypothetical protein
MVFENLELLAFNAPEFDCAVPTSRGNRLAVRAEADVIDPICMREGGVEEALST